jgi:hypothetical protein
MKSLSHEWLFRTDLRGSDGGYSPDHDRFCKRWTPGEPSAPVVAEPEAPPLTYKYPRDRAVAFLRGVLKAGPMHGEEVKRRASEAGIAYSALKRARKRLDLEVKQTVQNHWVWALKKGN